MRNEGGTTLVRSNNLRSVLHAIIEAGEVSRPAVAETTGLSLPTAISLIGELEHNGLVRRSGDTAGTLGRPAALYTFNERAGYVFGVDLGARKVVACVADLRGSVIVEATEPTQRGSSDRIIDQIAELHRSLVEQAGFTPDTAGVTSIAVGGVVKPHSGGVVEVTNLPELEGTRFASAVAEAVGQQVFVDNDVNLAAIGERTRGRAREVSNFVVISVGSGTGMGVVINNELVRGANGAAGELVRLPLHIDATDAASAGSFEEATSGSGVLERRDHVLADHADTTLTARSDVADIFDAAYHGDTAALEIVDGLARTLALGIAAVDAVLNPELVVLTGSIGAHTILLDQIRNHLAQLPAESPPIELSKLGSRGAMLGAISTAFSAVHELILDGEPTVGTPS